jgi:hypothetical protein
MLTTTNVICEVWSLDPKDQIELLYHQATLLIMQNNPMIILFRPYFI